jgi:hypothetical protein
MMMMTMTTILQMPLHNMHDMNDVTIRIRFEDELTDLDISDSSTCHQIVGNVPCVLYGGV